MVAGHKILGDRFLRVSLSLFMHPNMEVTCTL